MFTTLAIWKPPLTSSPRRSSSSIRAFHGHGKDLCRSRWLLRIYTVRGGKVVAVQGYLERGAALEAAGLSA